jgi:hypothetical protein
MGRWLQGPLVAGAAGCRGRWLHLSMNGNK